MFKIWEERGVYDTKMIADLLEVISGAQTTKPSEKDVLIANFQVSGQTSKPKFKTKSYPTSALNFIYIYYTPSIIVFFDTSI